MNTFDSTPAHSRNRAVNAFRRPTTPEARALVSASLDILTHYETSHNLRERRRRTKDEQHYRQYIEALICDHAYHHLMQFSPEDGPSLHISRNSSVKAWRYTPAWLSHKTTPAILDSLAASELIEQHLAKAQAPSGISGCFHDQTTTKAGPVLRGLMQQFGAVNMSDFTCDYSGDEIVVLKEKIDKPTSITEEGRKVERESQLVDYLDTPQTERLRSEMRAINTFLTGVDLTLQEFKQLPPSAQLPHGIIIDVNERHLKRYYTCGDTTFQSGGRLFNRPLPQWMWMSKVQRKCLQLLNGEQTIEMDFNSMNARLLYGLAEVSIPSEIYADLYAIPGFTNSRKGIKKMFNAMCFGKNLPTWTAYPDEIQADMSAFFHPSEQVKVQMVMDAIRKAHAPVQEYFGTGIGHRLMNIESNLMVALLLEIGIEQGIPALPVHDCLIIPRSAKDRVRAIMLSIFREVTGMDGQVKEG